jgi:predicted DCC family thiol-disulfide oxidoreductase YuxK
MFAQKKSKHHPVLLFDGFCNYCNSWVEFIIQHDKKKKFKFAALQSDIGKKILKQYNVPQEKESVVLIYNDKTHLKSSAGLHILFHLGGIYSIPFIFILLPEYVRDFYYDIIARNRYKWWGKRNECVIPNEDNKERFL